MNSRVQICCYSPEELSRTSVVNAKLAFSGHRCAYTTQLSIEDAIPSQVSAIKAERERDSRSVHQYATPASERSNAECGRLEKEGLWVI